MKTHQDLAYLNWIKSTTDNVTILEKINNFNGVWPRQFLFRLLYRYEKDFHRDVTNNIRLYLGF